MTADGRVRLDGRGRTATAAALLRDATGESADDRLAVAFATDVLDRQSHRGSFVISREEVRAWRAEREPEIAARWPPWRSTFLGEAIAEIDRNGPLSNWLAVYRTIHGEPRIQDR